MISPTSGQKEKKDGKLERWVVHDENQVPTVILAEWHRNSATSSTYSLRTDGSHCFDKHRNLAKMPLKIEVSPEMMINYYSVVRETLYCGVTLLRLKPHWSVRPGDTSGVQVVRIINFVTIFIINYYCNIYIIYVNNMEGTIQNNT